MAVAGRRASAAERRIMAENSEPTLAERIEAVEQAYEFMLAYAAQGREDEGGGSVREYLGRAAAALDGLAAAAPPTPRLRPRIKPLRPFSRCSMTTPARRA